VVTLDARPLRRPDALHERDELGVLAMRAGELDDSVPLLQVHGDYHMLWMVSWEGQAGCLLTVDGGLGSVCLFGAGLGAGFDVRRAARSPLEGSRFMFVMRGVLLSLRGEEKL
jgi:hypothetical protein